MWSTPICFSAWLAWSFATWHQHWSKTVASELSHELWSCLLPLVLLGNPPLVLAARQLLYTVVGWMDDRLRCASSIIDLESMARARRVGCANHDMPACVEHYSTSIDNWHHSSLLKWCHQRKTTAHTVQKQQALLTNVQGKFIFWWCSMPIDWSIIIIDNIA